MSRFVRSLSSNHLSHDNQVVQVVTWFESTMAKEMMAFHIQFPEWQGLVWDGSWVNTKETGVDPEYMSWVTDWLEEHLPVEWEDGEPYLVKSE